MLREVGNREGLGAAITKTWDSPLFKYSLIALITLVAVSCISVGAVAYSGLGLQVIGKSWSIALITAGSAILIGGGIVKFIESQRSPLSYDDYKKYKFNVKINEFFVYYDETGRKSIYLNHKKEWGNDFDYCNYPDFKKSNTELSLEDLKARSS